MKKLLSLLLLSVIISTSAFAQKKNVKKAYKLSEAYENPDFYEAESLIEPALTEPTTAEDPYTWWVAGHIFDRKIAWENEKAQQGQSSDEEVKQEAAYKAYDYFIKCAELETLPNNKGKISKKYTKKLSETLAWYYRTFLIFNYGLKQAEYEDYTATVKALDKHLSIVDLPFMKDYKGNSLAPKPEKDSTFYKIKFYSAIYESLSENKDKAIEKFESIKNNGYKESEIYQYLYNLYGEKKDSVNMMNTLTEGIDRFPDDVVFLGLTINIYLNNGKKQEALNLLNKAIERSPQNGEYYTIRGQVNRDLGKHDEAINDYNKAIELDNQKATFWYNKGEFLYNKGLDIDAVANNTRSTNEAKQLKAKVKEYIDEVKTIMNKVIELDNTNIDALMILRNIATREDNQTEYERIQSLIKNIQ